MWNGFFVGVLLLTGATPDMDRSELLAGVRSIASPGLPGTALPISDEAHTLVTGGNGSPVVAFARYGAGRVVLFGHTGYLDWPDAGDTHRLLQNAHAWVARGSRGPGMAWRDARLAEVWRERGVTMASTTEPTGAFIVANAHQVRAEDVEPLLAYVRGGGGMVVAATGWGWSQLNREAPVSEMPGNRLLAPMGLLVGSSTVEGGRQGFVIPEEASTGPNALTTLRALLAGGQATAAETQVLAEALACLPEVRTSLGSTFESVLAERGGGVRVSSAEPIDERRPLERALLAGQLARWKRMDPATLPAHPAAADFPGAVPSDAPRVERTVELAGGGRRWQSTGLYVPPGEAVTVRATGVTGSLTAIIGCHSDRIYHLSAWERAPEIHWTIPIVEGMAQIGSPFGGLLYFDLQGQTTAANVSVSGVVEAPHYVRGQTSAHDWARLRQAPGPWAEIEGDRVIVTVPSSVVREMEDPDAVARFWDDVADLCADLAAMPRERRYKERFVADRQISAGYMHAGYPMMTHLDVIGLVTDVERLMREGSWGHFHEIGHNHQSSDWTFEGTGEVTVNLFTLYVYDRLLGFRPTNRSFDADHNRAQLARFQAEGKTHDDWKRDPFLALVIYMQLQERFGWDAYKKVFAEYRDLPAGERPRSEQDKRDQWLVRFSRAVGENLTPLFEAWKIPIRDEAKRQVANLPPFPMP